MIDSHTAAILQKQIRRTGRSLLQYISESYPWTRDEDKEALRQVMEMQQREENMMTKMIRFLNKQRVAPSYLGSYPLNFTSLSFLALQRLLVLLVEHQKLDVQDLEEDVKKVQHPEARAVLDELLEIKQHNLETMIELAKAAGPMGGESEAAKDAAVEKAAS